MSTGYKLTTQEMTAYGGFQWEIGRWVETTGEGDLCGLGWLHYYEDPLLAVLHNPIHADVKNPRLFRVEVEGKIQRQGQMKAERSAVDKIRRVELAYQAVEGF